MDSPPNDVPARSRFNEQRYLRRYPMFPPKRHLPEPNNLKPGMLVSVRGFSATLSERLPPTILPDDECTICLNELRDTSAGYPGVLVHRSCDHAFHRYCIQKWRRETIDWVSKKASCPMCRAQVRESELSFPFNRWVIRYSDGSIDTVPATDIKTPRPTTTPFNPRHRDDLLEKEKNGDYSGPLPKRARKTSR